MSKKKTSAIGTVRIKKPRSKTVTTYHLKHETCELLDSMFQEREQWEQTSFKQANEKKYEMLGKCLSLFIDRYVNAKDTDRIALRQHLQRKLLAMNISVQKTTNVLTMIVRFVFNSDRNRANTYVKVLKAAWEAKKSPADLPDWIAENGGVEEIKRENVVKPEAILKKQKIANAKTAIEAEVVKNEVTPLATIQIAGVKGTYALLLAKPISEAQVQIIGALSDAPQTLVDNLINRMAKARVISEDQAPPPHIPQVDQDLLSQYIIASNAEQIQEAA